MSPLEIWLNFLVGFQLKHVWVPLLQSVHCGLLWGSVGGNVQAAPSITVINHHVKTPVHHRKRFSSRGEFSGDIGRGSAMLCLAESPQAAFRQRSSSSVTV